MPAPLNKMGAIFLGEWLHILNPENSTQHSYRGRALTFVIEANVSNWKPPTKVLRGRKKIGIILRRYREHAKLSYRQLARSCRINHATLHSLEIGRGRLETDQLSALSMVYGREFADEVLRANEKKPKREKTGS